MPDMLDDEFDPDDPSEATLLVLDNGQVLNNVHPRRICVPPCPIHEPSDHHMKNWPLVWRDDRRLMERRCPHGIGHPDPDDANIAYGLDPGVHGCDGCCHEP